MIAAAREAALAAGRIQLEGRAEQVHHKGAVDLVTEVDRACEDRIRAILSAHTPDIPILAEEGGGAWAARTRWIVDPLDGTTNFVHGFPFFAVSIALERDGELACGIVHAPALGQTYEAVRGQGATCNGAPIRVSECASLDRALVASGFAYDRRERPDDYLTFVRAFLLNAQGFRRAGAAALDLAMVARGALDGFWEFNLSPWDIAAGALLVTEAGGHIGDVAGGPLHVDCPRVLASNGSLHAPMRAIMAPLLETGAFPLPENIKKMERVWA